MKRHWILLIVLCIVASSQASPPLPTIHVWPGQEAVLPCVAQVGWKLETEHGRVVGHQMKAGQVNLTPPKLTGIETMILSVDGAPTARIIIHPMQMLAGVVADCRSRREELEQLGVSHRSIEKEGVSVAFLTLDSLESFEKEVKDAKTTVVVFTDRRDFPLRINDEWKEISMGYDKGKGKFSVIMDRHERIIDLSDGGVTWITARHGLRNKVILLPPDFDLKDINNVLFLKKELEK